MSKAKLFYSSDVQYGNNVYLGNYASSLPGSTFLLDKDLNIKSVLSIIEFPHHNPELEVLNSMFEENEDRVKIDENGIMYYNISIPDVNNPSLIELNNKVDYDVEYSDYEKKHANAIEVLIRCSNFIIERLKFGSVLVHCEKGQKRSPTMIIAYLVKRGMSVSDAIKEIASKYKDDDDLSYDWGYKYKKSRERWIELLQTWSAREKELSSLWKKQNNALICKWNEVDPELDELDKFLNEEEDEITTTVDKKREREEVPEVTKEKKKFKRAKKVASIPSTWRKKRL